MKQGGVKKKKKKKTGRSGLPMTFYLRLSCTHENLMFFLLNVGSISFMRRSEKDSAFFWMLALRVLSKKTGLEPKPPFLTFFCSFLICKLYI